MRTRKLIPTMKFVWHGGEPLVLPDDYLQNLYVELDAAFGPAARHKQYVDTAVQTNLYSISQQKIEFISQHRIGVGVSFDYVSGVRVSVAGKASERRVLDNMRLLREAGIEFGLITVLAQHNKTRLREAYDFFRRENIQRVRILPLFKGPAERSDVASFGAESRELADALSDLFDYWIDTGAEIEVAPLRQWLTNMIRKLLGLRTRAYDRRTSGDSVFVVNIDGHLYQPGDEFELTNSLGNCFEQRPEDLVTGDSYQRSLLANDCKRAAACVGCPQLGPCNTYPLFAVNGLDTSDGERCGVPFHVQSHIERRLREWGYSSLVLGKMLAGSEREDDGEALDAEI